MSCFSFVDTNIYGLGSSIWIFGFISCLLLGCEFLWDHRRRQNNRGYKTPILMRLVVCTQLDLRHLAYIPSSSSASARWAPFFLEQAVQIPSYVNCCFPNPAFLSFPERTCTGRKQQVFWPQNTRTKNLFLLISGTGSYKLVVFLSARLAWHLMQSSMWAACTQDSSLLMFPKDSE